MNRIIEAGHYYAVKGPTAWSQVGWEIASRMREKDDRTVLFVDDIHGLQNVARDERELAVIDFHPDADFFLCESEIVPDAFEILDILKNLPRKCRARSNNGMWFCSGARLTNSSDTPLCVLLDLGLTLRKKRLGFSHGVNVLPYFYRTEQQMLLRLIHKALPDFCLTVILYDLAGNFRALDE